MQSIVIESLLVTGEQDSVRVILGPYCLDFPVDDVLDVEEMPLPAGVAEGSAIAARVTLKPGARLLALSASRAYRDVVWRDAIPFALATRAASIVQTDGSMQEREEEFFAARGLMERAS